MSFPIQLIQAKDDDVASVKNSKFIYDKVRSEIKEIVLLYNSYHVITADQERETVAEKVADFFYRVNLHSSKELWGPAGEYTNAEVYFSRTEVQEFPPIFYRPDHIFDRDMDAGDRDELARLPYDEFSFIIRHSRILQSDTVFYIRTLRRPYGR